MNLSNSTINAHNLSDIPYGTLLYWSVFYTQKANEMNFFFLLFAISVGGLSNLLAYIVYCRPSLNHTNMGFFNRCLAFSNILTLLFSLLMYSGLFVEFDFNTNSNFSCQFIMWFRKSIREFSPVIETVFTVDRFLNVVYPGRFLFTKNNRNVFYVLCGLFVFILLVNAENYLFYVSTSMSVYMSVENVTRVFIQKSCIADEAVTLSSDIILATLRCFLPIMIMVVFNYLIVRKLVESSNRVHDNKANRERKDRQFTRALMLLNAVFIILNLPLAVVYLIKDVHFYTHSLDMNYILINFIWSVLFNLASLHYVLFFFLNFYFNRLFRSEVNSVFFKIKSGVTSSVARVQIFNGFMKELNPN
jgi:hypothetical protein